MQIKPATLEAHSDHDERVCPLPPAAPAMAEFRHGPLHISLHEDIAGLEREWRAFERVAACTAFQCFDWLAAWLRHVGPHRKALPVIVVGRDENGALLFLIPLAVEPASLGRRLTWLGSDLCDYNAPLLAAGFRGAVGAYFPSLWREICMALQASPRLQYDFIHLEKMPDRIDEQVNPFLQLAVSPNPNGAYFAHLGDDWERFYAAKRSATTRRRDRSKRKRLADFGEVRFVHPQAAEEIQASLDTLIEQKRRSFARMGVPDIFARPGYRAFFHDLATRPTARQLVHVSRLDVGEAAAAVNFGAVFRGRYYHIITSHDDGAMARLGPGVAHLHELMRYAIKRRCRVFDFTIGSERYKLDWCDDEFKLYDLIEAASWRGLPGAAKAIAVHGLKRRIKQSPVLWALAGAARARLGALRRAFKSLRRDAR